MVLARKRILLRLLFILSVIAVGFALVLYALRQNISLFYTPSEVVGGRAPKTQMIRLGGMVKQGSIIRASQGLDVRFQVTDFLHTVTVAYHGILPDLFRDGQGVVVEGHLTDNQQFQAMRVLAKHDANYMPPEVKAALAKKEHA
jgi:cytochrome c-type biogenesis protein CcmE